MQKGVDGGLHIGAQLCASIGGRTIAVETGVAGPDRPFTGGTLLPWFSATKPITALAVLQQWEAGRLDLDDPVADHVAEFAVQGKGRVTVRHLLTHTAGLAGAAGDDGTADVLLATACASPLVAGWVPGRRAAYSPRLGYTVLGEIVHRLDGRPFEAYVRTEVFEPLGMHDSWLALTPEQYAAYGERMAVMHDTTGGQPRVVPGMDGPDGFASALPSSSGVGPAGELLRFLRTLLGKGALDGVRVLSAQAAEAMCARHRAGLRDETFGAVIDWGLGVMVNSWHHLGRPAPYGYGEHASPRAFGHGGNQSSVAFADPEVDLAAVVVFSGMAGEAAHHRRTQPVLTALYEDLGLTA